MVKLANILDLQAVRNDAMGRGTFGASRSGGSRPHLGLDLIVIPGEIVRSPIAGKVTRYGYAYAGSSHYRYIQVTGDTLRVRIFYASMAEGVRVGDRIEAGALLGFAQDVSTRHGKTMIPHVHVEVWKGVVAIDPEPLLSIT